MKKITKVEKAILGMTDRNKYNSYRCQEHGIYQIRKDLPPEKQCCLYCKKKFPALTDEEIDNLLNQ